MTNLTGQQRVAGNQKYAVTHLLVRRAAVSSGCVALAFPFVFDGAACARLAEERVRRAEVDDAAVDSGAGSAGAESGSAGVSCAVRWALVRALDLVARWSVVVGADDDGVSSEDAGVLSGFVLAVVASDRS